jgi:hypothetical protein|nr:MAG TPA: hypothetical protein [Caudoviricetes sp.]
MGELDDKFFKVICEEVDVFGKQIHVDQNFGTIEEVHKFVKERLHKYPNGKWELYVIEKYLIK